MHQFWNTVIKVKDSSSYKFKLDNKKFRVNAEVFHDILQIYAKLPDQSFDIPPSTDEEIIAFIFELGYTINIKTLPELFVDHMHQPWKTFAAVINSSNGSSLAQGGYRTKQERFSHLSGKWLNEKESWGDSGEEDDDDEDDSEDEDNDDNDDDDGNDDDGNDDDGDHDDNDDDSDHERTEFDRDENPNLNQSYEEHEKEEEEYVNEFNDEEDDDDYAKEETKEE
ncbi:hypothetical protein Tco_0531061 [Tanacetum coccineum]